ncbi:MAG: pbpC [Verrucomicrobiaceae bacterium]|nr:pbpC [Verrucomicrobiaceae bacterium]
MKYFRASRPARKLAQTAGGIDADHAPTWIYLWRVVASFRAGRRIAGTICFLTILLLVFRLWPHPPLLQFAPSSHAIYSADGELLRLTLAIDDQYRLWTPLEQISPPLIAAVKLQEDRWFSFHPGFNPVSLLRGAVRTYAHENRQGGSTLTMQLARLMYSLNTRTPGGKLRQVAAAIWLEARYSKHDLLEAYLNLAPYGGNVQGVGAASLIYFGKTPAQLTLQQILTLAVIPQQPNLRSGKFAQSTSLIAARTRLFKRWQKKFAVSEADVQLASMPLPMRSAGELPFLAPHFTDLVIERTDLSAHVDTTLDGSLQRLLERQMKNYLAQRSENGVHNAVAMLLDTRDMSVKAWVGSANYFSEKIDGQVNGVLAKRSPGSTLKPFIYGLALDQGLLHPLTVLKDAPTAFGPFSPENFDGRFVGPITAQDALVRSRNIPAVWVASQLKNPGLYQFLKSAGIAQMQSEQHYGLSLVLGGGEVTMEELVSLYAMLSNRGELKPIRYLQNDEKKSGPRLLSEEASYIVVDMLRHNVRPDTDLSFSPNQRLPIAWKTGTSWGFRDAWTVGAIGRYVLAVWVGNFDGSGNPAFVGIDTAAPLFFHIADAMVLVRPELARNDDAKPPAGLARVDVCAASGDLPNAYCPRTETTWYIPGKSPIKVSTLHRPVQFDVANGKPTCTQNQNDATRTEVFEYWSSDMLRLFREAGMPRRVPPKQNCGATQFADAPQFTSPLRDVVYTLRDSRPTENIALQATVGGGVKDLFWFAGNSFIGRNPAQRAYAWRPEHSGWYALRVVDDRGMSAERDVRVEFVP